MSLVGTRPILPDELEQYSRKFKDMQHLSYRGSADIWRQMDTRVIIICRISNAALAGHM